MSSVTQAPVRAGTARLVLVINGQQYSARKLPHGTKGAACWGLRKLTGERTGAMYVVAKAQGEVACTCPDCQHTGVKCKHIKALTAVGLLGRYRSKLAPKGGA